MSASWGPFYATSSFSHTNVQANSTCKATVMGPKITIELSLDPRVTTVKSGPPLTNKKLRQKNHAHLGMIILVILCEQAPRALTYEYAFAQVDQPFETEDERISLSVFWSRRTRSWSNTFSRVPSMDTGDCRTLIPQLQRPNIPQSTSRQQIDDPILKYRSLGKLFTGSSET